MRARVPGLWSLQALALVWCTTAGAAEVEPVVETTLAEEGRSRAIAFRVSEASAEDRTFEVRVSDPAVVSVLRAPQVLAGERLGFLQVYGRGVGEVSLEIGDAAMRVRVVRPRAAQLGVERERPRFLTPRAGSAVWGELSVGVEWEAHGPGADPLQAPAAARLILPSGQALEADEVVAEGHHRQATFALACAGLPPGPNTLRLELERDGLVVGRASVEVVVALPEASALLVREAELPYQGAVPTRFPADPVHVRTSPRASGGRYAANHGARPAVAFAVVAPAGGARYQLVARAGGQSGGGALPSISLYVDQEPQPRTSGPLVRETWHRVTVGVPFTLSAGEHSLTPYYANDYYIHMRTDRNLLLDRLELLRLDDAEQPDGDLAGGMANDMAMRMSGGGAAPDTLRVAFSRPFEDLSVTGDLQVEGACWWASRESGARPPRVSLRINDLVLSSQRSVRPLFQVSRGHLREGPNVLQLVAELDSGQRAVSAAQTVWVRAPTHAPRPRRFMRWTLHDEAFEDRARQGAQNYRWPREGAATAFHSTGRVALELPPELSGRFRVLLEVQGQHYQGWPQAVVYLQTSDDAEPRNLGSVQAPGWWATQQLAAAVDLPPGPKRMFVAFEDDAFHPEDGDRNLFFQALSLHEEPEPDQLAPLVKVVYPPPAGHQSWGADVLVLQAADDSRLAWAELLVDGVVTGLRFPAQPYRDAWVLPLPLRGLAPGPHTVSARVTDQHGHDIQTPPVSFELLAQAPAAPTTYARAIRLLDRLAWGPDPDQLAAVLVEGEQPYLAARLGRRWDRADEVALLEAGRVDWASDAGVYAIQARVLRHALQTRNPARAWLVLWIENHFSTWIRKTQGARKWGEHLRFARLGGAPFPDLLTCSATSPAMLFYLDQPRSVAGALNENYARELLELHTLGIDGGYTQHDVTALARVLTGWTLTSEAAGPNPGFVYERFRFVPGLNGGGAERLLGVALPAARDAEARQARIHLLLEVLCAHPNTARFVSRKLVEHTVGVPAPPELVEDLARVFGETHGDLTRVVLALVQHPMFQAAPERLTTTRDFALRLFRVPGAAPTHQVIDLLARTSRGVFDRPTPDGYPAEDAAQADTNSMLQRWRLARGALWQLNAAVPQPRHWAASEEQWAQEAIDALAVTLFGRTLSEPSRAAARAYLARVEGDPHHRLRQLAVFVAQLPEANAR
jgi:Protein of unknown function (DUF1800)